MIYVDVMPNTCTCTLSELRRLEEKKNSLGFWYLFIYLFMYYRL